MNWIDTKKRLPDVDRDTVIELWWTNGPHDGYYDKDYPAPFAVMAMVPCGMGFKDEGTWYRKIIDPPRWRYKSDDPKSVPAPEYDDEKFAVYLKDMIFIEINRRDAWPTTNDDKDAVGSYIIDVIKDIVNDMLTEQRRINLAHRIRDYG